MADPVDQHVNGNNEEGEDDEPVVVNQGAQAAGDAQPLAIGAQPAAPIVMPGVQPQIQQAVLPIQPAVQSVIPAAVPAAPQQSPKANAAQSDAGIQQIQMGITSLLGQHRLNMITQMGHFNGRAGDDAHAFLNAFERHANLWGCQTPKRRAHSL